MLISLNVSQNQRGLGCIFIPDGNSYFFSFQLVGRGWKVIIYANELYKSSLLAHLNWSKSIQKPTTTKQNKETKQESKQTKDGFFSCLENWKSLLRLVRGLHQACVRNYSHK